MPGQLILLVRFDSPHSISQIGNCLLILDSSEQIALCKSQARNQILRGFKPTDASSFRDEPLSVAFLNMHLLAYLGARYFYLTVAGQLMREILVENARRRAAMKRGGGVGNVVLEEALGLAQQKNVDVLLLDEARRSLAQLDERQCRIVELRFFAGLSIEETADALGISAATVSRE